MAKPEYNAAWRRARNQHLRNEPLCRYCQQMGRVTPAQVVDHIIPIKERPDLRLTDSNLQSLCKTHHDATKQREERTGRAIGCDRYGWPIDPSHHWNEGRGGSNP